MSDAEAEKDKRGPNDTHLLSSYHARGTGSAHVQPQIGASGGSSSSSQAKELSLGLDTRNSLSGGLNLGSINSDMTIPIEFGNSKELAQQQDTQMVESADANANVSKKMMSRDELMQLNAHQFNTLSELLYNFQAAHNYAF